MSMELVALGERLSALKLNPNALPTLDIMCDGLIWYDERISNLDDIQMGYLRWIFRYRTSLILGNEDLTLKSKWDDLRRVCPGWIGFNAARCSANDNLASIYHESEDNLLGD